jgi:hypothetical protein
MTKFTVTVIITKLADNISCELWERNIRFNFEITTILGDLICCELFKQEKPRTYKGKIYMNDPFEIFRCGENDVAYFDDLKQAYKAVKKIMELLNEKKKRLKMNTMTNTCTDSAFLIRLFITKLTVAMMQSMKPLLIIYQPLQNVIIKLSILAIL